VKEFSSRERRRLAGTVLSETKALVFMKALPPGRRRSVPPGGAAHLPVKVRSLSIALGQGSRKQGINARRCLEGLEADD
jgi:hypothetical protein